MKRAPDLDVDVPRRSSSSPRRLTRTLSLIASAAMLTAMVAVPSAATAASKKPLTDRVSVRTGGSAGHDRVNSGEQSGGERRLMSSNGRFSVFATASELKGKNNLTTWQVYVRDRKKGTTTRVSVSNKGKAGNEKSYGPSISANGRYVSFTSLASNLVPGDKNGIRDTFVRDLKTKKTTRISVNSAGKELTGDYGSGFYTSISANGRFVAYSFHPAGLAPGDKSGGQAYLYDRNTGKNELVSLTNDGAPAGSLSGTTVSVSDDGRFVTFCTLDGSIAPGTNNGNPDVVVRDRVLQTTTQVSKMHYAASSPTISGNGKIIAFTYVDSLNGPDVNNPVLNGDTNRVHDVYLYEVATGALTLVSRPSSTTQSNGNNLRPTLSRDGRYVTYDSDATNLVAGDTNGRTDVYRYDTVTGTTIRVSVTNKGKQINYGGRSGAISPDGQQVQFDSYGAKITRHGVGAGTRNVYVRDVTGKWPALNARVKKIKKKATAKKKLTVKTRDIFKREQLKVRWIPRGKTKGKAVTRTVKVKKNKFKVKAPARAGVYNLKVTYDKTLLRKAKVKLR